MFDFFKKKPTIETLKREPYDSQYLDILRHIWKTEVPKQGISDSLQGELLRQLEKLRWEAQENGNINWWEEYSSYCKFILETLSQDKIFSRQQKAELKLIMDYLKSCGEYAQAYHEDEIIDDDLEIEELAYVDDNLYDRVGDMIALFYRAHPEPIPFI